MLLRVGSFAPSRETWIRTWRSAVALVLFGPAAWTPEEAVAAWVWLKGGDPGDYDKIREGYWDVPDSDPRYLAITVSKQADGRYSVDGACVK